MHMSKQGSGALARKFWERADYSKLAAKEMYDRQHVVLRQHVLPCLKPQGRLLDIGCSDGEFTEVLGRDCSEGLGLDLSAPLIAKAQARRKTHPHLSFQVGDAVRLDLKQVYDTVSIMGMLTYLVDDAEFAQALDAATGALKPGGYLVLKDSVRLDGRGHRYHNDGAYEALYRDEEQYLAAFAQRGLQLVRRIPIVISQEQDQASIVYLMRKPEYDALPERRGAIRLAIFLQAPEAWANVRTIWQAALADGNAEALVVLMPFFHDSYEWRRSKVEQYLHDEGVPFIAWDRLDLAQAQIDAVIYTSPYDDTRPAEYRFEAVRPLVRSISYVPYGIEIGGGSFDLALQYGQPVAKASDVVFARSQRLKDMYLRHCPTGDRHVVVSGYPRFDELASLTAFEIDPQLLAQVGNRIPVLWNTHFSFDQEQWSTFDILGSDIVALFANHPRLALIFRPHPLLWMRMKSVLGFSDADIQALKAELRGLGIIVDERADHRHVFACSHALISDIGSFLMDYLLTGKPVLYLNNPHGMGLNEEGEDLVSLFPKAESMEAVKQFVEALERGEDAGREGRLAAIPRFAEQQDGHVGARIYEHIKSTLAAAQ